MKNKYLYLVVAALLMLFSVTGFVYAETYETKTFNPGTHVIPMDNHQDNRLEAFGLAHAIVSNGIPIFRIIEGPDVSMTTVNQPDGDIYSGGPILVDGDIPPDVLASFSTVTVDTLTESFTSDQVFRVERATKIIVVHGIWGHTEEVLDWMKIPYEMVETGDIEANPAMLDSYDVLVIDCPGWYGISADLETKFKAFAEQGGEIIFTDIALENLSYLFPGYVSVQGNMDGIFDFDVHNVGEFISQYYGPSTLSIYTMGGGCIVDQVISPEVRVILNTASYGDWDGNTGLYRVGAFYFPYGSGIIEGFAYHPQEQTGDAQILSASLYGNKFIHGTEKPVDPPVPPPADENIPGKVTGGGWIDSEDKKASKSFGFTVKFSEGEISPTGQLEFNNHLNGDKFHSEEITSLVIDRVNSMATIKGTGVLNGSSGHEFEVLVSDIGEPGNGIDFFKIVIDGELIGENALSGGNIQIHK
ncbi:post-COAP-1 domain-containing protein [Phosphitispora fastidiosa]|uniref:post-COAP-1 domain-containing protein n=1 Tax=Phosphitispora fastidiosa TaxID=2837202 RepID=UPI001E5478C8|nr:post-COAP-1 domain-containing protein [Phosphitispora fastidiosa]MBU7007154.1 hypothetical protein [Phosphitispora fastidiosa]